MTGGRRKLGLEKPIFVLSLLFFPGFGTGSVRVVSSVNSSFLILRKDQCLVYCREKHSSKNGSMLYILIVKCCIRRINTNFNAELKISTKY